MQNQLYYHIISSYKSKLNTMLHTFLKIIFKEINMKFLKPYRIPRSVTADVTDDMI
jgi:hypothetical protein